MNKLQPFPFSSQFWKFCHTNVIFSSLLNLTPPNISSKLLPNPFMASRSYTRKMQVFPSYNIPLRSATLEAEMQDEDPFTLFLLLPYRNQKKEYKPMVSHRATKCLKAWIFHFSFANSILLFIENACLTFFPRQIGSVSCISCFKKNNFDKYKLNKIQQLQKQLHPLLKSVLQPHPLPKKKPKNKQHNFFVLHPSCKIIKSIANIW